MKLLCPTLHWSSELDQHFSDTLKEVDMFDEEAMGGNMNYYKELIKETREHFEAERFQ